VNIFTSILPRSTSEANRLPTREEAKELAEELAEETLLKRLRISCPNNWKNGKWRCSTSAIAVRIRHRRLRHPSIQRKITHLTAGDFCDSFDPRSSHDFC
jgi:hypothetical protein